MPTDVIMPQMGESIFEGTITKWLKKPGDTVQRDEPLFEISTDKVDAEIPSPASGVLSEIKIAEGNTVQINTVVGVIAEADGQAPRCRRSHTRREAVEVGPAPQRRHLRHPRCKVLAGSRPELLLGIRSGPQRRRHHAPDGRIHF